MNDNLLKFSIVIPTHKRPEQIKRCLESIFALNYPSNKFEVIVIDDGETLPKGFAEEFKDKNNFILKKQRQTGPAQARNNGATLSSFEYIVFTDDDCIAEKHWLMELSKQFTKKPDVCLGGKVRNALKKNTYSETSQILIDYLYEYFKKQNKKMFFFTSNNLALPKKTFMELDGFDPSFPLPAAEDRDFCKRLIEKDKMLVYQPNAIINHYHNLNLRSFWRQHFNYGRGAYHFHSNLSKRTVEKRKSEPLTFYLQLIIFPLKKGLNFTSIKSSILLFVSQFANVSGYFYQKFIR